jgi:hypothetical protein
VRGRVPLGDGVGRQRVVERRFVDQQVWAGHSRSGQATARLGRPQQVWAGHSTSGQATARLGRATPRPVAVPRRRPRLARRAAVRVARRFGAEPRPTARLMRTLSFHSRLLTHPIHPPAHPPRHNGFARAVGVRSVPVPPRTDARRGDGPAALPAWTSASQGRVSPEYTSFSPPARHPRSVSCDDGFAHEVGAEVGVCVQVCGRGCASMQVRKYAHVGPLGAG